MQHAVAQDTHVHASFRGGVPHAEASEEKGRLSQSEIDRMVQEAETWAQ